MAQLFNAHHELFTRPADERFETLADLARHCRDQKARSARIKRPSTEFRPVCHDGCLALQVNGFAPVRLNNWSLTQLCGLAGAAKETVNRLRPETACQVLTETLCERVHDEVDFQTLTLDDTLVRAVNGDRYKRLWNADLLGLVEQVATDFTAPQRAAAGGTGLYAGEQDMFCFLIDPTGWTEIGGEAFAPGLFLWNSEVGKRTVGLSTFWFQAVCANHIVWDAVEIVEITRRHTGDVRETFAELQAAIEALVRRRDARKDGFAKVVAKAMGTIYGQDAEETTALLTKAGFTKQLADKATAIARQQGSFTLWSVVDALTQLARELPFASARTELDQKASALLALAA